MDKVRIGLVGAGNISASHLGGYAKRDDIERVMIADQVGERAAARAAEFDWQNSTDSVDELLARDDIDAISICTWNNSHADIAIRAMEAGKHVLSEKPMSRTVEEAEAVAEAVERTGMHYEVGYVRRYGQNAQTLKRFIDAGDLGDLYYAKSSFLRRAGNPGGWFADVERSGGGPLIDVGVHNIDLAWWLLGKPKVETISANVYHELGPRSNIDTLTRWKASDYDPNTDTVEDLASAVLRFDNGASLVVDVSYSLHAIEDETSLKVYGTKGGAELEPELKLATEQHNTIINIHPQMDTLTFDFNGFNQEIGHFVELVKGNAEPVAPISDGVQMMKILMGIYESGKQRREIVL